MANERPENPVPEESTPGAAAPAAAPGAPGTPPPADSVIVVEEVTEVLDESEDSEDSDEISRNPLGARLGVELLGSFVFVLAALGIALYAKLTSSGELGIALGAGLALAVVTLAFGHISGGHFNPVVTLGSAAAGRTPWMDVLPYWLAQLVGGIAAAAVLLLTVPTGLPALFTTDGTGTRKTFFSTIANGFGSHSTLNTLTSDKAEFTLSSALIVEAILAAVLVAVFLSVTRPGAKHAIAPFAIGLTFAVLLLISLPITNGGLNPVRATAAALFAETWALEQLWLFWVAPLLGAVVAGLLHRAFVVTPPEAYEDAPIEEAFVQETVELA